MAIDDLLATLREEGSHETYPPASEADIKKTEAAIGHTLPDSYKTFVSEFSNGAYIFEIQEVSAVGEGNRQIGAIQSIVRGAAAAPDDAIPFYGGGEPGRYGSLVPFGVDHNGNEWCFIVEGDPDGHEYDVAYLETEGQKLYGRLSGFTEWLSVLVREQEEVIRTMYGEDVIENEIGLG